MQNNTIKMTQYVFKQIKLDKTGGRFKSLMSGGGCKYGKM